MGGDIFRPDKLTAYMNSGLSPVMEHVREVEGGIEMPAQVQTSSNFTYCQATKGFCKDQGEEIEVPQMHQGMGMTIPAKRHRCKAEGECTKTYVLPQ